MQPTPNTVGSGATQPAAITSAALAAAPKSPYFAALTSSAPPPATMTPDAMLAELGELFSLSAAVVQRASDLFAELRRRNIVVEVKSPLFRDLIPRVASGRLTAEAVSAFADAPKLLDAVERLPPDEQRRLAADGPIQVVRRAGGEPIEMSLRAVYDEGRSATVISGKRILTPAEQESRLRSRRAERSGGCAAKSNRPAPQPFKSDDGESDDFEIDAPLPKQRAEPPTESEHERLVKAIDTEMRNSGRLTPRQFAELVVRLGWGPIR